MGGRGSAGGSGSAARPGAAGLVASLPRAYRSLANKVLAGAAGAAGAQTLRAAGAAHRLAAALAFQSRPSAANGSALVKATATAKTLNSLADTIGK